jgi:ABC-type nitrate/sulfonate/bicarbonate transport system substrate-binding protein
MLFPRKIKRSGSTKFLLVIGAMLAAVSGASAQTYVKIGIISPTFGHAPFYVARDKGFFKNEGLVGEVIVMNRDDLIGR